MRSRKRAAGDSCSAKFQAPNSKFQGKRINNKEKVFETADKRGLKIEFICVHRRLSAAICCFFVFAVFLGIWSLEFGILSQHSRYGLRHSRNTRQSLRPSVVLVI